MAANEHEIVAFSLFRELLPDFPSGLIDATGESPDFVVTTPALRIGIEHTDLYWERTASGHFQEGESLRRRVRRALRDRLDRSQLPPLWVAVHFNDVAKFSKKRTGAVADAIFEIVKRNVPELDNAREVDWNCDWRALPEETHSVIVRRLSGLTAHEVTAPEVSFIPTLTRAALERVILEKESRLPRYRDRADETWLLVVAHSGSLATVFTDSDPSVYHGIDSDFGRIFVLWMADRRLVEVKLNERCKP